MSDSLSIYTTNDVNNIPNSNILTNSSEFFANKTYTNSLNISGQIINLTYEFDASGEKYSLFFQLPDKPVLSNCAGTFMLALNANDKVGFLYRRLDNTTLDCRAENCLVYIAKLL